MSAISYGHNWKIMSLSKDYLQIPHLIAKLRKDLNKILIKNSKKNKKKI